MPTAFIPNYASRVIYRVVMLKGGKWEPYTNFHKYVDAQIAAAGLITGGTAKECHILEIGKDSGKIVAKVTAEAAPGWPHGRAVVKRV